MKFLAIILLCILSTIVESRKECIPRKGKNTPYCVCNATYCDDLDPIVKQEKGSIIMFETNQSGDRLKETKLKFVKSLQKTNETYVLHLNRGKRYQKIKGFGGAFTDSSGINLNLLPKAMAENVIKDYFAKTGIEYSMARVPIGGCDFSPRGYTYADQKDDFDLKTFKLQKEDIEDKIPFIKLAKNVSSHPIKLFASPWSAPAWMKQDGKLVGTSPLIGKPGEKYYKTWANYFVKFLDSYKENGINFWGLTVENEPGYAMEDGSHPPNGTHRPIYYSWNGLGVSPQTERDFLKLDLGPALTKAGYGADKLNVMIYDHGPGGGVKIFDFVHTVNQDTNASKYMKGTAFHCYGDNDQTWVALDIIHKLYPNQYILMTECCQEFTALVPGYIQKPGNWDNAQGYARDIVNNLQHWSEGWVEWNLVLDMHGLPHWSGMMGEAPIMVNTTGKEYYKDAKFYVIGHFSKFLAPGSERIAMTSDPKANNDFNYVSFVRPDDNSTVVIVFNTKNNEIDYIIDDPLNGKLTAKIAARSVQTYIYWN